MDFSFAKDAGLQRRQPQSGGGSGSTPAAAPAAAAAAAIGPAPGPSPGARIAIPSFRDVQQAERQRTVVNMFRPSGAAAAVAAAAAGAPQQQQLQQPPAFLLQAQPQQPSWPYRPQGAPPAYQQQQQQRPPDSGRYLSASAAPPPRPGFQQPPPPPQQHHLQQQQPGPRSGPGQGLHAQQGMLPPQAAQQFPPNAIIVSRRQEGNPVLRHIRNVRWQWGDIVPDYLVGRDAACLFLSLRYHLLKPEYIHARIKELQRSFRLRIILCHVDTEDAVEPLAQVTRAAIGNECTLICGWSNQECARYLETFKSYENKPAEVIQKDLGTDYVSRATSALTTVRGVNKTDVKTLGDRFGSMAGIFKAGEEELQACPGIGPVKARRLHEAFSQPFRRTLAPAATGAAGGGAGPGSSGAARGGPQKQGGPQQQAQQQRQQAALPAELQQGVVGEDEDGGGEGDGEEDSYPGSKEDEDLL